MGAAALVAASAAAACGGGGDAPVAASSAAEAAAGSRGFMPDAPRSRAVVWAVGDGDASSNGRSVARLVAGGKPNVFLYLGDVYDSGTAREFRNNYAPAFGALARKTAATPGNHDWPNRGDGYQPYWKKQRGRAVPAFYEFSAGGWQILSLNSEIGPRADQMRWLRARLRSGGTCRIAYWHRPRFSAGRHGDYASMDPVWRALQGRAGLVVSGHDHDMQRMRPKNGLVQVVSGAGGRSHYAVDRSYSGLAFADDRSYGALRITLVPGSLRMDFVSAHGKVLDSSRLACRR